jgi:ribonucleoside-diphosphate reductase alpha chain
MTRERLPDRRACTTFEFDHETSSKAKFHYKCSYSRFADGRLGELFLQNTKAGSDADANARESAIAASLALQFGCPIDTLRGAVLRNGDSSAATPLGAALDRIAKDGGTP